MHFDEKELDKLTKLSRINCTEAEKRDLFTSLSTILSYVEQLDELDLKDVAPCHHIVSQVKNTLREDEPKETLSREEFLANSPAHISGMIRVPTVFLKE